MKGLFKLVTGLGLGATLGIGVYWLITRDREAGRTPGEHPEGMVAELKDFVAQVVAEGKAAAAQRRRELERELGQSV
jgi:hypothetical protein